ncbi:MAG: hypothetical protein MH321_09980 [Leptospiraceae bacterium]|nr:hypothetical protein [Leptospiraceae bacterium]
MKKISLLILITLLTFGMSCGETQAEKDKKKQEENLLNLLIVSAFLNSANTAPFSSCDSATNLTKGVTLSNQAVSGGTFVWYKYTAVATESNTYTVTPVSGDPDLFVFFAGTLADTNSSTSTVDGTSNGTGTESITRITTNAAFRCIAVLGFRGAATFSIRVN